MEATLTALGQILGPQHLLTADDSAPYLSDWRRRYQGRALAVALPGSVGEVQALVHFCRRQRIAIVPQGGNTGLCGGATPDASGQQLLLSLRRLRALRNVDVIGNTLTVEAGLTLAEVQQAAAAAGRLFPLSLASEGSCQIGGNLSTNAGGVQVLRYGNARDLCLGLEAVLPNGELWQGLRSLRKDNTGYDLKQLLIGAEGTLGVITAATLKLFPQPSAYFTAMLGFASLADAVVQLRGLQDRLGDKISAYELISGDCLQLLRQAMPQLAQPFAVAPPWVVLIEASDGGREETLQAAAQEALSDLPLLDSVLASNRSQAAALWALRENMSEAQRILGPNLKHDISLPIATLADFVESCGQRLARAFPEARPVVFGHVGDGNLHYNVSGSGSAADPYRDEAAISAIVYDEVTARGGSISAEHGIGQLKRQWLAQLKSPCELSAMRAIKQALDPDGLFNPGKVLL